MSGYGYSSAEQGYGYTTTTSYPTIPQYTQSQISSYYEQYHQYPPQPYQIIPDYYVQPVVQNTTYTGTSMPSGAYGALQPPNVTVAQEPPKLVPPPDEETLQQRRSQKADRRNRSPRRTWTCDLQNCTSTAQFTRSADLQRHQATVHGVGIPEFPCTVPRCTRVGEKGFTRRDHLVEHLRNFHHIDIPKRRPGERSANPLGLPHFQ